MWHSGPLMRTHKRWFVTDCLWSEQTEKLFHIIMPDLLNYLEMIREIIEKRIEKNKSLVKKENIKNNNENLNNSCKVS